MPASGPCPTGSLCLECFQFKVMFLLQGPAGVPPQEALPALYLEKLDTCPRYHRSPRETRDHPCPSQTVGSWATCHGSVKGTEEGHGWPLDSQVHFPSSRPCILSSLKLGPDSRALSLLWLQACSLQDSEDFRGKQMTGEALMVAGSAGGGAYRRWNTNQA